jgi:glycosyltransferase involved in cell wall biosynthesis
VLNFHPKSAKLVVTVYDMIHEKFSGNFSKYNLIQKVKAKAVKQADHVICISESTRRDLISLLETPFEKTSVIHLGSSLTGTHVSSKRPDTKKPYILYVGSRSGYKNFEGLLRAFSQSSRLKKKFMLLCFGGGKFNLHELNLIKLLKLNEDDILILSGDDELLASLYTFASAFVCPSLYEGFGLSSLEAMRFGCPVVCANSSSLPEVVGGAAEFFDPENFSEIQFALEQVVFSPQRSKRLVDLGYERAKLFSWDECARRTLDVYNSILEK